MSKFEADTNTNGHSKVLFCSSVENVPSCLSFLNRQLQAFGMRSAGKLADNQHVDETDIPALLNTIYELIVIHQQDSKLRETNEGLRMRQNADLTHLQQARAKLRDEVEQLKREKSQCAERERQANERSKQLREELARTSQELERLRKEATARTENYQHEQRRTERELNRLKGRLQEVSSGSGSTGQPTMTAAISLTSLVGFRRAEDGAVTAARRRWCTAERSELQLHKQLVAQQDDANRAMLVENTQLKRTLTKVVLTTKRFASQLASCNVPGANRTACSLVLDADLSDFTADGADACAGPEGTVICASCSDLPTEILLSQLDSEWKTAFRTLSNMLERASSQNGTKRDAEPSLRPAPSNATAAATGNGEVEQLRNKLTEYERVLRAHEQLVRVGLAKLNTSTGCLPTSTASSLEVPSCGARRSLSLNTSPVKPTLAHDVAPSVGSSTMSEQCSPNTKANDCQSNLQVRADTLKRQLLQLVLDENANANENEKVGASAEEVQQSANQ